MTRSRKTYALVIVVIAIPLIALALWRAVPRDEVSRSTSSQALELLDQKLRREPQVEAGGGRWPEPGVYRYATDGFETIDAGLFDGSHDYGGVSTVTLWPVRCGVVERWQVLTTRWSQSGTCGGSSGRKEASYLREFHEFFGVAQEDSFECDGWSGLSVQQGLPSRPVRTVCRSAVTLVTSEIQVVGPVRVDVAGEEVDAVHLKGTSVVRGESSGTVTFSEWRRRADGLLLRRKSSRTIDSDASGGFSYGESYAIRLLSLSPER